MSDLRKYISSNGVKDISTLSYLTGIPEGVLNSVADGKLSLSAIHKDVIKSVLPNIPDLLLSPKHPSLPADTTTARGLVPEGRSLIQIQAGEVVIGDMLLASHKTSVAGSRWTSVLSIKEQGRNVTLSVGNGIDIGVSKTNLVKVARLNTNE